MLIRNLISKREKKLPILALEKLIEIAIEKKDIISLGIGEPDFLPPKNVVRDTKKYLEEGYTHYSTPQGRIELREMLTKKLKRENKINANSKEIIVTTGATEAILLSLMTLTNPGENVLLLDPYFPVFRSSVEVLGANIISIPTYSENNFYPNFDNIKIKDRKNTKLIIINTPCNPTGAVFSKKTLEEIIDFAIENDLFIICDEAYEKFVYKDKHISIASFNGMDDHVLTLYTFSKTYGMAGFRIGYATGNEEIIDVMKKFHVNTSLCAPTISQMAALSALRTPKSFIRKIVSEYNKRRKFLIKRMSEIEIFDLHKPEGAFYMFPRINSKMNSVEFSNWLLKTARVTTMPGSDFGYCGKGFVRFSYATDFDLIKRAMNRIEKAVKNYINKTNDK